MALSLFPRQHGHKRLGRRDWPFLLRPPDLNWDCGVDSYTLAERVRARTMVRLAPTSTAVEETPSAPPTAAEAPNLGTETRTPLEAPLLSSMMIVASARDLQSEWATKLKLTSTETVLGCEGGGSGLSPQPPAPV